MQNKTSNILISVATLLLPIAILIVNPQEKSGEFSPPANVNQKQNSEQWTIERVLDGDTLIVRRNEETRRVRLCGIDAPEKDQPRGTAAKDFIEQAIRAYGNEIAITFVERDRYQRWIAEVFMNVGHEPEYFLNEELIVNGYAWPYKQYWKNCPNQQAIAAAEELANQNGQGIWLKRENIAPWTWRRK